MRRRLQRTLRAAEHYAGTRARLKREDIELRQVADELTDPGVGGSEFKIYRGLDEDGRVYYRDRPPGSPPNLVELN